MSEDVVKKSYSRQKAKQGPVTHHMVFYYFYGASAFDAVPFKLIAPWTEENKQAYLKMYKGSECHQIIERVRSPCA